MYISDIYEDDLEVSIKVVIVGNGAVGKSSMIQRYCRGIFTQNYKKTIGVDFLEKRLRIMSEDVRLMLWDTAGQEEFDAITKAYYRGAQACVVAFSTTDRVSFDAVKKWKKKVEDECGQVPMVLVQNKIDLIHEAQVTSEEVERLAKEHRMRLFRTSVKEDLNVASVFHHLADSYLSKIRAFNSPPTISSSSFSDPFFDIGVQSMPPSNSYHRNNHNNNNNYHHPHHPRVHQIGSRPFVTAVPPRRIGVKSHHHQYHQHYYNNNNNNHINSNNNNNKHYNGTYGGYGGNLHLGGGGGGGGGGYSPQDYLNNPMFDSLHHRRYWPQVVDRTITLRPLGNITKKNIMQKKLPAKNACKVL